MRSRLRRLSAVSLLVLAGAAPVSSEAPSHRGLDIYWVDVEGGAATLVVTPAGESILVDTGWPGARDAERIHRVATEQAGLTRIDHLVTTHWHTDHFGGLTELARRMPVGQFYDHRFPEGAASDIPAALKEAYLKVTGGRSTVLRPGDALKLRQAASGPAVTAKVVVAHGLVADEPEGASQVRACAAHPEHPPKPDDTSDNHRSAGIVFSFGAFQFLDLGDLTWNVEHKLICPRNLVGAVDVYQVTHHGLDNSNNPALVKAVAPTVAVVNNGPKKGGKPAVYRTLKETESIKDVFQVHRNIDTSAAENAPPAFVANDEEACPGNGIHLQVDPAAAEYTVEIPAKKTTRTYKVSS